MTDIIADDICRFWFDEIEHSSWFKKNPAFDQDLKNRFGELLEQAKRNELDHWCDGASGYLGLIILLDQFSRNIHRESADAFAADALFYFTRYPPARTSPLYARTTHALMAR